jgi:hypothetical protein
MKDTNTLLNENDFEFSQTLNADDYVIFFRHAFIRNFKKPVYIFVYALFVVFAVYYGLLANPSDVAFLYMIPLMAAMVFLSYWLKLRQARNTYKRYPNLFNLNFRISYDSITFGQTVVDEDGNNTSNQLTKNWTDFSEYAELDGHYILYINRQGGLIFKKESLTENTKSFFSNDVPLLIKKNRK